MTETSSYSTYELLLAGYTLLISFAMKEDLAEEQIKSNWLKLQNHYPYLYDYSSITCPSEETDRDVSNNPPLKFELPEAATIPEALDQLTDALSKEIIQPARAGQRKSLLAYAKLPPSIHPSNDGKEDHDHDHDKNSVTPYTIFSLYTSHCLTDLKSMTFLATAFLNLFEDPQVISYPMKSIYPTLLEHHLIPSEDEREALIKHDFNYRQPLNFDYTRVKAMVSLTEEEKKVVAEEQTHRDEPIYFVSRTEKYTASEVQRITAFCKEHGLSVQALLNAAYLKAALELFESNCDTADVVTFQVIFDHRRVAVDLEECLGNFPEAAYPSLPLSDGLAEASVLAIAKALTPKIKAITPPGSTSLFSEAFRRYRLECYHPSNRGDYAINFSFSASNVGSFQCFHGLTPRLKERLVGATLLAGSQYPLPNTIAVVSSHLYHLVDGSCNHTLHFPYAVILSPYIRKLLARVKVLMLESCEKAS